ncbi:uncharacterized protein VTP21DRAFT_5837 [Calcarisporiella thermophila]|uniref:uncharacterized protein n=1 Tax=Calcarisporiella thermophila TaxID=911321 RepID=UPI003742CB16
MNCPYYFGYPSAYYPPPPPPPPPPMSPPPPPAPTFAPSVPHPQEQFIHAQYMNYYQPLYMPQGTYPTQQPYVQTPQNVTSEVYMQGSAMRMHPDGSQEACAFEGKKSKNGTEFKKKSRFWFP